MSAYVLSKSENKDSEYCRADELHIGELGEIRGQDNICDGAVVLKVLGICISLSNPRDTWAGDCSLLVKRLPPGTVVKLEVKGNA